MKSILMFLVTILLLASAQSVMGYEEQTHRSLSEQAVERSILRTDQTILENLGLKPLYGLNDPRRRQHEQFPNYRQVRGDIFTLAADGAAFEDVPGWRVRHHFYNPLTERPARLCGVEVGFTSPDWALEDRGQIDGFGSTRHQEDSFADTRQFFLDALTAKTKDERDANWGRTFQGLGQVIHHLEDMTQPQHVRNDMHVVDGLNPPGDPCAGDPSWYEKYTEDDGLPFLFYGGYDPVYGPGDTETFATPRRFWDTNDGKGLAEYTNRNFVSAGTNFDHPNAEEHPLPEIGAEWEEDKTALCKELLANPQSTLGRGAPPPFPCVMTFISTDVGDAYRPSRTALNKRTSTLSIFSEDLKRFAGRKVYTLNKFNFFDAYQFLIPRAVGYSAGLINYFFRGKITVTADTTNPSQSVIKNEGTELLKGTFTLYYDDLDGNRSPVLKDEQEKPISWPTPPEGLAAGQAMPLPAFAPPSLPAPKTPGEYMLVFQGDMGEEKAPRDTQGKILAGGAVAGKVVHVERVEGFFTPSGRLTYKNGWQFSPDTTLQYGNTDWRGTAGSVSWNGPYGRYINLRHTSALSHKIFSDGKVLATAPGPVLGVAIQFEPTSHTRTLIAVVADVGTELPDSPDLSTAVWGEQVYLLPLDFPGSWVHAGSFTSFSTDYESGLPLPTAYPAHYFFNASGTEAVSVKPITWCADTSCERIMHLKVNAQSRSADFTLDPAESQDKGGLSPTSPYHSIAHIAADYIGDRLVQLDSHYREFFVQSDAYPKFEDILQMSSDWVWTREKYNSDGVSYSGWDYVANEPCCSFGSSSFTWLRRRVEFIDLRAPAPVVTYVETYSDGAYTYGGGSRTTLHETHREKLAWQIADKEHDVTDFHDIDTANGGSSAFVATNAGAGTFVVGSSTLPPHVIGVHTYENGTYYFMYPDGELSNYGGGPVGR